LDRASYPSNNNHPGSADGGTVTVAVDANSSVQTSDANAPAIIAQSVGGGGGYFTAGASGYAQGVYAVCSAARAAARSMST